MLFFDPHHPRQNLDSRYPHQNFMDPRHPRRNFNPRHPRHSLYLADSFFCDSIMTTDSYNNNFLVAIIEKVGKENKVDI